MTIVSFEDNTSKIMFEMERGRKFKALFVF
jgi:hypothetical protein